MKQLSGCVCALILVATAAFAQTGADRVLHRWEQAPNPEKGQAYFTNLETGAQIETPYILKFGLSGGWGLAPIEKKSVGKSGHHHLLINRDLPLDFTKPLPFNDKYIHFGKGQMETVLNLPPGTYTLRMLLADDAHIPRFVYSKPIKVTVTKQTKGAPTSSLDKALDLMLPDKPLKAPFVLRFHASGLQVATKAQAIPGTGHFRLTLRPDKGSVEVMDFPFAQTEVGLGLPPGNYGATLDFVDNLDARKLLVDGVNRELKVLPD
jgi:hypothetical protein